MASTETKESTDIVAIDQSNADQYLADLKAKIKGSQQILSPEPDQNDGETTRPPRLSYSDSFNGGNQFNPSSAVHSVSSDIPAGPPDSVPPTDDDDGTVAELNTMSTSADAPQMSAPRDTNHHPYPARDGDPSRNKNGREIGRGRGMSNARRPAASDRHYEPDYRGRSSSRPPYRDPEPRYMARQGSSNPPEPRPYRSELDDRRNSRSSAFEAQRPSYNAPGNLPPQSGRRSPPGYARPPARVADTYRPGNDSRYRSPPPRDAPPPPHYQGDSYRDRRDSAAGRGARDYSPPYDDRSRGPPEYNDRRRSISPRRNDQGPYRGGNQGGSRVFDRAYDDRRPPLKDRLGARPPSLQERLGDSPASARKSLSERIGADYYPPSRGNNSNDDRDGIPRDRYVPPRSPPKPPIGMNKGPVARPDYDRRDMPFKRPIDRDTSRPNTRDAPPARRTRDFSPPSDADLARDRERMRDRQRLPPPPPSRRTFTPPPLANDAARDYPRQRDHDDFTSRPPVSRPDDRDRRYADNGRPSYADGYPSERPRDHDMPRYPVDDYSRRGGAATSYPNRGRPRSPSPDMPVKRARDDGYSASATAYWDKEMGRGYDPSSSSRLHSGPHGRLDSRARTPPLPGPSYDDAPRGRPAYDDYNGGRRTPPPPPMSGYQSSGYNRARSPGPAYDRSRRTPPPYDRRPRDEPERGYLR